MNVITARELVKGGFRLPGAPVRAETWSIEVLRGDDALERVEPGWRELYRHCAGATPFQSYDWLRGWWAAYGRPGRLVVVTARRDGRLVAGAALMLRYRGGMRVLRPLGDGVSDFTDVLLHDDWVEPAAVALSDGLRRAPGQVVDLPEVRPAAAAWRVRDAWPGRWWQGTDSTCLEVPGCLETMLDRLPAKRQSRVRQGLRRLDRVRIVVREVPAHQTPEAVRRLLELHRQQWEGRQISPAHVDPRFGAHLTAALPGMVARGEASILEYVQAGEVVACDVLLVGRDLVGGYLYGYRPEVRTGVPVQLLILRGALSLSSARGVPAFSMLRGAEEIKLRWNPRVARNGRLLLRTGVAGAAYEWAVRARAGTVTVVQNRAPRLASWAVAAARSVHGGGPALPPSPEVPS